MTDTTPSRMHLHSLTIHHFRDVKPGTTLRFRKGHNLVLGPNGTGKTTLLNLLALVIRSDFDSLREPLDVDFEVRFQDLRIEVRAEVIKKEIKNPLKETERDRLFVQWECFLTLRVSVGEEKDVLVRERSHGSSWHGRLYFKCTGDESNDIKKSMLSMIARQQYVFRMDEGIESFQHLVKRGEPIFSGSSGMTTSAPSPIVCRTGKAIGKDTWGPRQILPFPKAFPLVGHPNDIVDETVTDTLRSHPAEALVSQDGKDPHLMLLTNLLGVDNVEVHVPCPLLEEYCICASPLSFFFSKKNTHGGAIRTHDWLGWGQKRLVALLSYLSWTDSIDCDFLIADELIAGFHHSWVEPCLKAIGDRQTFLTSSNPLLFDHMTFTSIEDAQEAVIVCRAQEDATGRPVWAWQNLSEEDAWGFFGAYQAGIQHVGDILRTRGIWLPVGASS